MTFSVKFYNRDFTRRVATPWKSIQVERYSHHAIGGPKACVMFAKGSSLGLWEFLEMLRCPLEIIDDDLGKEVWWGFLNMVLVSDKKEQYATLDDMYNNIQVRYTDNLEPMETSWAADADSIATYGQKDMAFTEHDIGQTQAEYLRDTELESSRFPQLSKPKPARGDAFARLSGIGIWDTTEWQYFKTNLGLEQHIDIDSYKGREIGEDDRPECAQSFQLSSTEGWDAEIISLRIRKHGSPTDNVEVDLCADNGGEPGSSLEQIVLGHANFEGSYDWIDFVLATAEPLALATTYWIKTAKAGSISVDDCYMVDGDGAMGYANGEFLIHNVGKAYWYGKPMDMNFMVKGSSETTEQIEYIVENACEFILDTDLKVASGIYRNQYRDGDNSAMFELIALLEMGTTNNRRMLARVLPNRHLEVYEEPVLYAANFSEDDENNLKDHKGAPHPRSLCPVGMWLNYESEIPSSVDTSKLIYANYLFVEQAEYNVLKDEYTVLESRKTKLHKGFGRSLDG